MKKFLLIFLFTFIQISCVTAQTLNGEVTFDWISKNQMQRDENIEQIRKELFTENLVLKYNKKGFKTAYKDKLKDAEHVRNYDEISKGKSEDAEKIYCGFYWKKYLVAYGIQYKNKPDENLYYDGFGNLKWIDKYSLEYPNFPYASYQYNVDGSLRAVFYFNSPYDQYIYDENGKFKGRWYKENMYDRRAKVILTRTNWD